jgi:RNA polymerase sigma-70 factor (ECF subfamily)
MDTLNHALTEQIRRGSEAAWAELFRRDRKKLLAVAARFVSPTDAEDVVQEAFLSTLKARAQFRGQAHPSTWLYRATVNAALMHLRARRRRPTEALEDSHVEGGAERLVELPVADARLVRAEAGRELARGLEVLKPVDRALFKLRFLDELSTEESAERVGLSVAATKTRLSRARAQVREAFLHQAAAPA